MKRSPVLGLVVVAAMGAAAAPTSTSASAVGACPGCVIVVVDMDAQLPGFQSEIEIAPGTEWLRDVSIWIYDPTETANLFGIGFIGGVNRGLAFGHMPDDQMHSGQIAEVNATAFSPVITGHTAFINNGIEKLFVGPELQYFEFGSTAGIISANPTGPVVTFDVRIANAAAGDVFSFFLGDMTAVWLANSAQTPGGAFSSQSEGSLDAGGDAVADGTLTAAGTDPDQPAPSPPAGFLVDYVDGPPTGVGAVIRVVSDVPAVGTIGLAVMVVVLIAAGAFVMKRREAATSQ